MVNIYEEPNLEKLIKEMEEYIKKISELSKEDSIKILFKAGIVDENGELRPEFRRDE
jgi:hypothetical protein